MNTKIKVSIIGITGYTGLELLRVLQAHPQTELVHLVARQDDPVTLSSIAPQYKGLLDVDVTNTDPLTVAKDSDVVFLCLPHTASQSIVEKIIGTTKIIDLGADFRLSDADDYKAYYGSDHSCPQIMSQFTYGLPELTRDKIAKSDNVANPGCYALLIQLMLLPYAGHISSASVMAVTGSSGFGKTPNDLSHHPVHHDNMQSYKINTHRHTPEIIRTAQIKASDLNIVPTLGPFSRGIFATAFVQTGKDLTEQNSPETIYQDHPFTRLQDTVSIANVAASNYCDLNYRSGNQGCVIVQGAIDNLTRGSSGNAVQCMNLMFGLDETAGLDRLAPIFI